MPTLYQKVFGKNGILAYGKAAGTVDHLFIWAGDSGPDGFDTLAALVDAWNRAPKSAGQPGQKALLFCQSFEAHTLSTVLDRFTQPSGGIELCWGACAYWADVVFAPSPPKIVLPNPNGSRAIVATGDTGILLESGKVPESLDDFTAAADGSNLALLLGGSTSTSWLVDDAVTAGGLTIDLSPVKGFVAGAVGICIDWAKTASAPHPVRRVAYSYVAPPADKPAEEPLRAKVWSSQFAELIDASSGAGARCRAYFDPRDNSTDSPWVVAAGAQKEFNSHLLFGAAVIHTSLYAADGSRFLLTAKDDDSAAARFGFIFDMMDVNGKMTSGGRATFHPEGSFAIVRSQSVSAGAPVAASFANDLIAGSVPTEFFDVSGASHIEFVKGPAFLIADSQGAAFPLTLLDDRDGLVRTAHLRFRNAGGVPETPFHSQPSEAALFEDSGQTLGYLRRRRRPIGKAQVALPVFPFPGYAPAADASDQEIVDLDTTHLASYRRSNISRPAALAAVAPEDAGGTPELAVTPQGLLAKLAPDGSYAALYLGNPDSINERDEFCITISNPVNALYEQVQHALASNQLFMVFKDTPADVLKVISPSVSIYARDFAFSVRPDDLTVPATKLRASVMLVKFFSGRSLDDLVKVPQTWALQQTLAPSGNVGIKELTGLGPVRSTSTKPELKHLESIWFDAAWQGILLLDLPIDVMPNVLESLRPGIAAGKKLSTHHFGLNAVAAKKTDLSTPRPRRLGSAFGLINYELCQADHVTPPTTADSEPGSTGSGGRSYSFVIQSLQIAFENSQISSLAAQLNVKFSHLFWDKLSRPDGADPTVELYGSYDRRVTPDGKQQDVFSFVTRDPLIAKFEDSMLSTVTVSKAQLSVTAAERDAENKLVRLSALVSLDATIGFNELIPNFPLFSVKEIRVSSFGFKFDYQPEADPLPATFKFGFFASGISAEIDFTPDAIHSLLSFLPVKIKGMAIAIDRLIDLSDLHFQPLQLGISNFGTKLQFGFLMELDFGALGQLSGVASGLRVPFLLGWAAGKKLVCGIQFPGVDGKFDVGIQQFIRLQADSLKLVNCNDPQSGHLTAVGIQAINARVIMLGHRWPEGDLAIAIFIPLSSNRKPSWAFGLKNGQWYVGGGHRIDIAGSGGATFQGVLDSYKKHLRIGDGESICDVIDNVPANPGNEDWAVAAEYSGDFVVGVLVADPKLYGIRVKLPVVGDIDILYRRVDGQLGIFSLQYILPGFVRTIEVGVASIRLPGFRVEVETDGGWLLDVGYPRNNDYSVSCQVEVGIFIGAGGFYYGKTSALSADLLRFDGGYGYLPPDPIQLAQFDVLRFGFAARVGIGRSFTIGILSGDASLTLFGGLEGAAGYLKKASVADPMLFALRGVFGLMVDVQCSVEFPLIRATARILAYTEVGLEIRRVLAKNSEGVHQLLTLPVTIFAEIGITVTATVRIHVGCVSVSINLSFSAVWHYEEPLGRLSSAQFPLPASQRARIATFGLVPPAPSWDTGYRYWSGPRELDVYVTVLPCLAAADDVQLSGNYKECAIGTMLLSALETDTSASALGDLTRFLLGWVLIPPDKATGNPNDYHAIDVTLDAVAALMAQMKPDGPFWNGFAPALLAVVPAQFAPTWKLLSPNQDEPFAVIPPWPGSSFTNKTAGPAASVTLATTVTKDAKVIRSGDCAFVDYCQHALVSTLSEVYLMLRDIDQSQPRSLSWSEIWSSMRATLQ